jgi:hypothetical protein
MDKRKWRGSFCHGFAPDQNSEVVREVGQSPARVFVALVTTLYAVTPAKAGAQFSSCFTGQKLGARLRGHDG